MYWSRGGLTELFKHPHYSESQHQTVALCGWCFQLKFSLENYLSLSKTDRSSWWLDFCFIPQEIACYRWKSPVFPRMWCIKYSSLLRILTVEPIEIIDKVVLTYISEDFVFESIWDGYRSLSVMEKRITRNFLFWLPEFLYLLLSHSLQFRQN